MEHIVEVNLSYNEKEVKKTISFYILEVKKIKILLSIIIPIIIFAIIVSSIYVNNIMLIAMLSTLGFLFYYLYYTRVVENYINF